MIDTVSVVGINRHWKDNLCCEEEKHEERMECN